MKKFKLLGLVAILAIFMSTALYAQGGLILKAEYDVSGNLKDKDDSGDGTDTKAGFGVAAEFMAGEGQFVYGIGGAYLFPRGSDDFGDDNATFSFIPVYGVVKFNLMQGNLVPQVIGHIGYDFWTGSDELKGGGELTGGLYWAAGAGLEFGQLVVTGMYKVFSGKFENSGITFFDGTYTTITLGAGFAF